MESIAELVKEYGFYGAMVIYLIYELKSLTDRVIAVVSENSRVIGEVTEIIRKCKQD